MIVAGFHQTFLILNWVEINLKFITNDATQEWGNASKLFMFAIKHKADTCSKHLTHSNWLLCVYLKLIPTQIFDVTWNPRIGTFEISARKNVWLECFYENGIDNFQISTDINSNKKISKKPLTSACYYICQDCLVHLGDLGNNQPEYQVETMYAMLYLQIHKVFMSLFSK